jgi:hypothetical protein
MFSEPQKLAALLTDTNSHTRSVATALEHKYRVPFPLILMEETDPLKAMIVGYDGACFEPKI